MQTQQLLREVFWQLEDLPNRQLTPRKVRSFLARNIDLEIFEHYALSIGGSDFWSRVENAVWLHLESRK